MYPHNARHIVFTHCEVCTLHNKCILHNVCKIQNMCTIQNVCILKYICTLQYLCTLNNSCTLHNVCTVLITMVHIFQSRFASRQTDSLSTGSHVCATPPSSSKYPLCKENYHCRKAYKPKKLNNPAYGRH